MRCTSLFSTRDQIMGVNVRENGGDVLGDVGQGRHSMMRQTTCSPTFGEQLLATPASRAEKRGESQQPSFGRRTLQERSVRQAPTASSTIAEIKRLYQRSIKSEAGTGAHLQGL